MRVTLVSNSPGEVATFVRPVATELKSRHPEWRVELALVPCPYATGAEASVVRAWGLVDDVWSPAQTTWNWIRGRAKTPGAVVFLGGDPWHALLLKRRFSVPCLAYFSEPSPWEETRWLGGFDRVLLGYREDRMRDGRFSYPGDLRVDAVTDRLKAYPSSARSSGPTLAIFPGSRWLHLKAVLGPFLHAVQEVVKLRPELRVMMSVSPFVSRRQLDDAAANPFSLGLSVARGTVSGDLLQTEEGATVELVWGDPYQVIADCDLALSLPGTNTAELAIGGKPTVVPLSDRAPVGGGGLLGLLDRLPGLGFLKNHLKYRKYRKLRLLALPNQLAGREVMPEFFVRDDLSDLVAFLHDLLGDPARCRAIGEEAQEVMGPPGAAARLVDALEALDTTRAKNLTRSSTKRRAFGGNGSEGEVRKPVG